MENLAGAGKKAGLRVAFDRRVKLEFHGSQLTSDARLLAYRELDEALGLTNSAAALLHDWRTGDNTQHSMAALLRQSLYSRLAGCDDTNDAERLAVDPAMRQVVGGRATERAAASTSQMGRFETEVLTHPKNLKALNTLSGHRIDRLKEHRAMWNLTLDNRGEVSLSPAHEAGWGVKVRAGHGCDSEKPGVGVEKGLEPPTDGRIITKTTEKSSIWITNINSNGKSRFMQSIC
jgi:hypothetical protein